MGTFTQKTDYLLETKSKIKDRLNSLGASITAQTTFRNYLTWLDNLYTALSNKNITGLPDSLEGKCEQTGTPTPSSPQPINITTGRQVVSVSDGNTTNDYEINLGKNLFDFSVWEQNATINGSGASATFTNGQVHILNPNKSDAYTNTGLATSGTLPTNNRKYAIEIEPNSDYTFSFDVSFTSTASSTANSSYYSLLDSEYKFISFTSLGNQTNNTRHTKTITTPSNAKYITFRLGAGSNQTTEIIYSNIMIEKGSQATTFSPYKTPIYLGKIGTYQDYIFKNTTDSPYYDSNLEEGQWYIHKEIGRVVLNGSETNWKRNGNGKFYREFSDIMPYTDNSRHIDRVLSDHFEPATNYANQMIGIMYQHQVSCYFFMLDTTLTTVDAFKTWLASNNTIVYYVLNTPTNTLIEDEELINQLNEIEIFTVISEDFYN